MEDNYQIIRQIAEVQVPSELIENINIQKMMEVIGDKIDKVEEFKDYQDEFNNMGFFKKFWAKLKGEPNKKRDDALLHMGDLLNMIAQLTVVNTALAKALNSQQIQLKNQQTEIKEQNGKIEIQNDKIEKQTISNGEQQQRILGLVSLTDEQEHKIKTLREKAEKLDLIETEHLNKIKQLNLEFVKVNEKFAEIGNSFNSKLNEATAKTSAAFNDFNDSLQKTRSEIDNANKQFESYSHTIKQSIENLKSESAKQNIELQQNIDSKIHNVKMEISASKTEIEKITDDIRAMRLELGKAKLVNLLTSLFLGIFVIAMFIYIIVR